MRVPSPVFIVSLAAAMALVAAPLAAQRAVVPPGWQPYTRVLDSLAQRDSVVGASVDFVDHGQVVASHQYGFADRDLHQRVTDRTIFHWGSITKTLTAIAIMQLRDRGRLSLDDPIVRYVPELRLLHDPFGSIDSVTIRMLLSHSAGFQDPTWPDTDRKPWHPFEPTTWAQLVAMMPYQEVLFKPGSRYSYSNPGFIYLGRVIEKLTGDPWEDYIQKNIFAPLGLARSYFRSTPYYLAGDRSNNYVAASDSTGRITVTANGRDFDPGITVPNGGWNAPLTDMARYLAFLTNATGGDTALQRRFDTVLARTSLAEMWRPQVPIRTDTFERYSMGLSFFVRQLGSTTIIEHTGEQAGFESFIMIDPATSRAMVGALNTVQVGRPDPTFGRFYAGALEMMFPKQ